MVVVDQVEELFTECTSEAARSAFLTTLAHADAEPDGLVSVVFAMRNDFAGALRTHEAFATAVREQPFRVSQMSTDLCSAIHGRSACSRILSCSAKAAPARCRSCRSRSSACGPRS